MSTSAAMPMSILLAVGLPLLACDASQLPNLMEDDSTAVSLAVEEVASGLESPVYLTAPAGDPRLFIVEQVGRIRIVEDDVLRSEPFLDLTGVVNAGGERGLLSLAFHPSYATNGMFYVDYTDRNGDTRVERYSVSADGNRADPASAKLVLAVAQPYGNHNGGHVLFGPDGMLYITLGDGGSGGDPLGSGQDTGTLLGALLRIDVDREDPYAIPQDNPFADGTGGRGEIWAYGLRNPWRVAFDSVDRLLYIADVGQNQWEEIDVEPDSAAGVNYGWNIMEAGHCYAAPSCNQEGLTMPVAEYDHSGGNCSVTGGFVYRGSAIPSIQGHYFYSDYCGGWLRSFRYDGGVAVDMRRWEVGNLGPVTSFGRDGAGELYVLSQNGTASRIIAAP